MSRAVQPLVVAGATLLISGCAPVYLAGGKLPMVEPRRIELASRPTATLRLSHAVLKGPTEKVTRETGLFETFTLEPAEAGHTPSTDYTLRLSVDVRERPLSGGRLAYDMFAYVTLLVLPVTRHFDVTLTATVEDRHGSILKAYTFEDSIRQVEHVATLMIPVGAILDRPGAMSRTVENMLRHLYGQIEADGLLSRPSSTSSRRFGLSNISQATALIHRQAGEPI